MKRISKTGFVFFAIGIMILLCAHPAIAESVSSMEYRYREIVIPWGDGIDNDDDGEIDEWGETGVENGTMEINETYSTINTWNTSSGITSTENGIWIASYVEAGAIVQSSWNSSVSPTQTCYSTNQSCGHPTVSNVLNVLTYYINVKSSDIMTGVQEMYFRSPLMWDDAVYQAGEHYLNIFDEDDNLIFATRVSDNYPQIVDDQSVNGTSYKRVYYKLEFPFRNDIKYTFKEYVKTIGNNPVNNIGYFVCQQQDIANDNETASYIFHGTAGARKLLIEASWGMVCTVGIGRAGTEHIIRGNDDGLSQTISTVKWGRMNDVKALWFTIPLRTTSPLNITFNCDIDSGAGIGILYFFAFANVTSTFMGGFNITDPDPTKPNKYRISIVITNMDDNTSNYMTFVMYDGDSCIYVTNNYMDENYKQETIQGFEWWIEMWELDTNFTSEPPASEEQSVYFLNGVINILAGIIIGVFAILTGWTPAGVFLGGIATSLIINGVGMVLESNRRGWIDVDLSGSITDNLLRLLKPVIDGFTWAIGGLLAIIGKVIEGVVWVGEMLMQHGAAILEAIVEIIYFIVFLIVLMGWSMFLTVMKYVLHGDYEGAWRSVKKGYKSTVSPVKKVYKTTRKIQKGRVKERRRIERGMRAEQRQDRRARAYEKAQERRTTAYEKAQDYRVRSSQAYRAEQEGLIDEEIGLALRARKIE